MIKKNCPTWSREFKLTGDEWVKKFHGLTLYMGLIARKIAWS